MKRLTLCACLLTLIVGLVWANPKGAYRAAPDPVTLYGAISSGKSPVGIYSTTTENPPTLKNLLPVSFYTPVAGVYANGNYYFFSAYMKKNVVIAVKLEKYDANTWTKITDMFPERIVPTALTYDAKSSQVYGCYPNTSNGYDLRTLNLETAMTTVVATLPQQFVALYSDNQGRVYGIGVDGTLYLFDLATGKPNAIGSTGVVPSTDIQGACFDESTGTAYWFARTATESSLYTIDSATGKATKVTDFDNAKISWCGVFSIPKKTVVKPAFITKMRTEFAKTSLTGSFIFTLPDKAENGDALSETLSYKVYVDDAESTTGEGQPGAEISVPVTVTTEGIHKFAVSASLNDVSGQITSIQSFVGQDTPKAPANFQAVKAANSNEVTISWDAVTTGVNGGYINAEAAKYTLTRMPDRVVLGNDITATSFVDKTINSMNNYYYTITVTDGVKTSQTATSNTLLVAEDMGVLPPFSHTFLNEQGLGFFKTIDANNDGNTWTTNKKNVYYNASKENAADDWLVSPKMRLEAGKSYHISMTLMASDASKTEKFEITYGKVAQPSSLTTVICPATTTSSSYTIDQWFTPIFSGSYYIGIHALSDKAQGALGIMNFSISGAVAKSSPAAATDITTKPDAKGELRSQIDFACPTTTFGNTALDAITKVVVTNQTTGSVIATETDVRPGQKVSVIDPAPQAGMNQYTIVCYNTAGAGVVATAGCWAGIDIPAAPSNVTWYQRGSQAVINWEAPTVGMHGGYIDPSKVTYSVYNLETSQDVKKDLKVCIYTDAPQTTDAQTALTYLVYAKNDQGTGDAGRSNSSAFGVGYECPYYESFSQKELQTKPWLISQVSGNNAWQLVDDLAPQASPQDKDRGMVGYSAAKPGSARIESPVLNLTKQVKATLKFWYYMFDTNTDLKVVASNDCGVSWSEIATVPKDVLNQWAIATIDLTPFKDLDHLQIGFEAANNTPGDPVLVDNIFVGHTFDYDLGIQEVNIPTMVHAGNALKGSVVVANKGFKTIDSYQVEYYLNSKQVGTVDGHQLEANATETLPLEIEFPVSYSDYMNITCKVVCSTDEKPTDNEQATLVLVTRSPYPKASDTKAEAKSSKEVVLTWTAPNTTYYPIRTDDMESYEAWSVGGIDVTEDRTTHKMIVKQDRGTIGDYTLIDKDHQPTQYIMGAYDKPIPHLGDGMVCMVMDMTLYGNKSSIMDAHSGNKMLCFWTSPQNDDYFILPELAPNSKYISFWAKSLSARYGLESFDIMVSTTGKEPSDFTVFKSVKDVPTSYKTDFEKGYSFYEFDLPADTKYVAIHYNSKDVLALLIDDITCTPNYETQTLTLNGYNIYRDGVKVNDEPVKETTFTDRLAEDAASASEHAALYAEKTPHYYNVTAVYEEGESGFSETAEPTQTDGIDASTIANGRIYTISDAIVIDGMAGANVAIYTLDGRLVSKVKAAASTQVPVSKGVYLVKVQQYTRKVVVK